MMYNSFPYNKPVSSYCESKIPYIVYGIGIREAPNYMYNWFG